jgi:hypothetical protein
MVFPGGVDMRNVAFLLRSGGLVLLVLFSTACATPRTDPWFEFMETVLRSAGEADTDALTRDLTLYRWEEISEFYRQAAVIDMTRGAERPPEKQLYDAMRKDVQMFIRSYEDLFGGRPVRYCTKRLPIDGVECHSVIFWVQQGKTTSGILIHAVWKRPSGFRVLEWVDTAPATAAGLELWKKRARLRAPNPEACVFPDRIEFEQEFQR